MLDLQDGASEVEMVLDDDACKFRVGECFFDVTNEEAEEFVEEEEKDDAEDVETLREEQNTVKAEMEKLKSVLYGRFGNSINLETGSDD